MAAFFSTSFNAAENALILSIVCVLAFCNVLSLFFAHFRLHRRALTTIRVKRAERRQKRLAAARSMTAAKGEGGARDRPQPPEDQLKGRPSQA